MSEMKFNARREWETTIGDVRKGSIKYVESFVNILESLNETNPLAAGREMLFMGYALGVFAGKLSDFGIEGFTLLLNGIRISLKGEKRKEEIQFAIWDKDGNLHTSEEGYRTKKGGQS